MKVTKHLANESSAHNKRMQPGFGKLRLPQPLMRALYYMTKLAPQDSNICC